MTSPISTERHAVWLLESLAKLGIGTHIKSESLLGAKPRFLAAGEKSAVASLARTISQEKDFFLTLQEVARFIFAGGDFGYQGPWRQEYNSPKWTQLVDNPGLLADSWIASLSPTFRQKVGRQLLNRLLHFIRTRSPEIDSEFIFYELSSRDPQERVEFALRQAGTDGLLSEDPSNFAYRYPFRAETLAEVCLYPLPLPENFYAGLQKLVANNPTSSRSFLVRSSHGRLDIQSSVFLSRTLWALAMAFKDGHLQVEESAKRISELYGFNAGTESGSELESCFVQVVMGYVDDTAENLRYFVTFVCSQPETNSKLERFGIQLKGVDAPTNFALLCRWLNQVPDLSALLPDIESWFTVGFNPTEALQWLELGNTPNEAALARDAGLKPCPTPAEIRLAGLSLSNENLSKWNGLNHKQILDAIDRGFTNAEEYAPVASSSMDSNEVARLRQSAPEGFSSHLLKRFGELLDAGVSRSLAAELSRFEKLLVKQIVELEGLGLDSKLISEWCSKVGNHSIRMAWLGLEGPPSYVDAQPWLRKELGPRDYLRFKDNMSAGMTSFDASWWAACDIPPSDVQVWIELGYPSATDTLGWKSLHMSAGDVATVRSRGIGDTKEFLRVWIEDCNSRPSVNTFHVRSWMMLGVSPRSAGEWESYKLGPTDYESWNPLGVTAKEATIWAKSGRDKRELDDWKRAGFTVRQALKWVGSNSKITPLTARRRSDAGIEP